LNQTQLCGRDARADTNAGALQEAAAVHRGQGTGETIRKAGGQASTGGLSGLSFAS